MSRQPSRSSMADFVISQALGKGSYGSVYKVMRKADGHYYAIKEVNIRKLQPREREDAVNEIRILASIKHKNIVRYCDAFVERDNLYIVMEFAELGDISRQIDKFKKANKYIDENTIWSYLIQICNSLHCLHSKNILHRDIKPKNVFLTAKNHVRLGDLGCAKLIKSGMARTQIGTPYYMSPEIWMNKPYNAKSDVWALGCLVYELAMLTPPFCARDINSLAAKVKTAPVPRVTSHYSKDLVRIIHAMLTKDPRQRPDVATLLSDPAVTSRMQAVLPADDKDDAWAGESMRTQMIATIRVPAGFGYGGLGARYGPPNGGLKLPASAYPTDKKESSRSSNKGDDTPRSEASGKENNVKPSSSKYSRAIASAYNQQPKRPLTHVSSSVASNVPRSAVSSANKARPSAGMPAYNRNAQHAAPAISSYARNAAAYPSGYGARQAPLVAGNPSRAGNPSSAQPSRYAVPSSRIASRYAVPSAPVSSRYAAANVPISSRYAIPSSRNVPSAPMSRIGAAPSAYGIGANRVPSAYDRNAARPYVAARIGYRY